MASSVRLDSLLKRVKGRMEIDKLLERSSGEVMKLGLPSVAHLRNKYKGCKLIIAGGGPSIKETLPDIRRQLRLSKKTKLVAINRTHDWLLKKGIKPHFSVMIDPKPWVANYQTPTKGVKYLLGAKCDMAVFDKFKGHPEVYLWHPLEDKREIGPLQQMWWPGKPKHEDWICIPGHSPTGLRCVNLFYELGIRQFEMHGMDCSRRIDDDPNANLGNGHAYEKYTKEELIKYNPLEDLGYEMLYIGSRFFPRRYFECTKHMARQLGEFRSLISEYETLVKRGEKQHITVKVAGTGALPYLAALEYQTHVNPLYNQDPTRMPYTEPPGVLEKLEQVTGLVLTQNNEAAA